MPPYLSHCNTIKKKARGKIDCVLASDCDPEKQFACSGGPIRGQCISLSLVCDGVEQCLNGRDEADCCNKYCDDGVTCIQDDRYALSVC